MRKRDESDGRTSRERGRGGDLERGPRAGSPIARQRHDSQAAIVPHFAETLKVSDSPGMICLFARDQCLDEHLQRRWEMCKTVREEYGAV